jgi:uncharacterized protein YcgI (DUF1989 family)
MLELEVPMAPAPESQLELDAGEVRGFIVKAGQFLGVTVAGEPLAASLYAFAEGDPTEWLSVGNTRILLGRLRPRPGDRLFSNRRRALFVWVEDSSGLHDLLLPAGAVCARGLGVGRLRRLTDALHQAGADRACAPDPLNLFLGTHVDANGRIQVLPPATNPGDQLLLRATVASRCVLLAWQQRETGSPTSGARALRVKIRNCRQAG